MKPTARYLFLLAVCAPAAAVAVSPHGIVCLDTIATPVGSADIHLRVDTRARAASWGLAYNVTGDSYDFVIVNNGENRFDTDITAPVSVLSGHHDAGGDTVIRRDRIEGTADGSDCRWSVILRCTADSSTVYVGQKTSLTAFPVGVDLTNGIFGMISDNKVKILRHTIESTVASAISHASFDSVDALNDYIAGSTDPYERVWNYLDRDTDQRIFTVGGNYTLATVSDGKGGYDIVYLGGARVKNKNWQPLMIKGRLKATPFIGHFDLVWFDATGSPAPGETNATIENNNSILRLNFPSHNSQVRFAASPRRSLHQ